MDTKKIINLYFDFEFTSLSPDAQPISLGIVSDEILQSVRLVDDSIVDKNMSDKYLSKYVYENKLGELIEQNTSKSFYAEFTDFDLNRCDNWVKENVVGKLMYNKFELKHCERDGEMIGNYHFKKDTEKVKQYLKVWLSQFSDYNIQFICDCGTSDFYHLLKLIGDWETTPICIAFDKMCDSYECQYKEKNYIRGVAENCQYLFRSKIGLPKLPENISPVPQDLNDLIAFKKGISVREAFDLNREQLAFDESFNPALKAKSAKYKQGKEWGDEKHNALWDAKVIKQIYNKLNQQ